MFKQTVLAIAIATLTTTVNAVDTIVHPADISPTVITKTAQDGETVLRCVVIAPNKPVVAEVKPDITVTMQSTPGQFGMPPVDGKENTAGAPPTPTTVYGDGPAEVSATNLTEPHGTLAGTDLTVWNQFCRGRNPSEIGNWRFKRCNELDSTFKR